MHTGPHSRLDANPVGSTDTNDVSLKAGTNFGRLSLGRRRCDAALMAVLAIAGVWSVRVGYEPISNLVFEMFLVVSLLLPAVYFRYRRQHPERSLAASCYRVEWRWSIVSLAVTAAAAPCLVRFLLQAIDVGGAWEMVWLTSFGVAAMSLALLNWGSRETALSVVSSGFLVLFVAASSDRPFTVWIAIGWAIYCLWWLVANHWERLDHCLSHSVRRVPMMRISTTLFGLMLALVTALIAWGRMGAEVYSLAGFMPTSGGESYSDGTARSGVGDGDAMVAAEEHAAAFGAVDSDIFLESKQPSLFDMFDDTLGEPFLPKAMQRAIALQQDTVSESKQQPSESDQTGQSFSTSRKPRKEPGNFKNTLSGAALHWIGAGGTHLAMERFQVFDGIDWTEPKDVKPDSLTSKVIGDRTWFFLVADPLSPLFSGTEQQAVKVMRLESTRIPVPASVAAVSIADVDRDDFFGVAADGSLLMPGRESIPRQTSIRLVSRCISEDGLRAWGDYPAAMIDENDAQFLDYAERELSQEVSLKGVRSFEQLAATYGGQKSRGWAQIECIVNVLRDRFEFDRQADCGMDDPLLRFFHQRRGGDHMFATAASVMLRSLGYDTRLVLGFYVNPKNRESSSGEYRVFKEDSHAWLEVHVADDVWVPVEATPGYLQPRFRRTWTALIAELVVVLLPVLGLAVTLLAAGWYWRAIWGERLCLAIWYASGCLNQRTRLRVWARILDVRCWLANHPRPQGVAQRRWLKQFCLADRELGLRLEGCFDALDALVFGEHKINYHNWNANATELMRDISVGLIVRCRRESKSSSNQS